MGPIWSHMGPMGWSSGSPTQCRPCGPTASSATKRNLQQKPAERGAVRWDDDLCLTGCVWKCCVPLHPMVLLIIIPMKNGYFIGGIPHFQTYPTEFLQLQRIFHILVFFLVQDVAEYQSLKDFILEALPADVCRCLQMSEVIEWPISPFGFVWKCWVNIPNEIAISKRDNDQQNHWENGVFPTFSDKLI